MADSDDRPDWLPAPPESTAARKSSREQQMHLLSRLPSLLLVALGFGAAMLAVASLFSREAGLFSREAGLGGDSTPAAILLGFIAGLLFWFAYLLRTTSRFRLPSLSRFARAATSGPMTTQQFFVRCCGPWQSGNSSTS